MRKEVQVSQLLTVLCAGPVSQLLIGCQVSVLASDWLPGYVFWLLIGQWASCWSNIHSPSSTWSRLNKNRTNYSSLKVINGSCPEQRASLLKS